MKSTKTRKKSFPVVLDGHEYVVRYMPDGNQWVPWVFFIYKDAKGNPIGTSGQGYSSSDSAVKAIHDWHTGFHWDGWLSPSGEFFPVRGEQHSLIVDLNLPNANGKYEALLKKGWLIMRHSDFPTEWNYAVEISPKQYDWADAWCKKWGRKMPEIFSPTTKN